VGNDLSAKLTDFGLAKSFTQSGMSGVTMAGEMAGTLAYMPPGATEKLSRRETAV